MNKQQLIDYIKSLPPLPAYAPDFTWLNRRITIRDRILNDDLEKMLSWAVIQSTMNTDYKSQHYHLDIWEHHTGLKVNNLGAICEFGGGYGAMLKCLREREFKGCYYGYDFPEFVALQQYYTGESFSIPNGSHYDLLISICAISESNLQDREKFIQDKSFDHALIRYQADWDDVDNHEYFSEVDGIKIMVEEYENHWYLLR